MMVGQNTAESILRRLDEQILDLISIDSVDDKVNRSPSPSTIEMTEAKRRVQVDNERRSSDDMGVAVRRRGTINLSAELSDNEGNDDDLEDSNDDHKKRWSPHMLLACPSIVNERRRPEGTLSFSDGPLQTVYSDETSLASLRSQVEGSDSLSLSSGVAKYSDGVVSSMSGSCTTSSSTTIHDAVDAIREEASRMEAALAIDQLQTMQSELKSMKKLLHAQSDQMDHLKKELKSKDETLAIMALERDLCQADMEAFRVSQKAAAARSRQQQGGPSSLSTMAETQQKRSRRSRSTTSRKSTPPTGETVPNHKSPAKLEEIRNTKALNTTTKDSKEKPRPKGIYLVSKGSTFSTPRKSNDKNRGDRKIPSMSQQDESSRGASLGSSKGSSQGSSKENGPASKREPFTTSPDSQFKPIRPIGSKMPTAKQRIASPVPVKAETPAAIVAPTKPSYRLGITTTGSAQNSILADTTASSSATASSAQNSTLADSNTSSFSEKKTSSVIATSLYSKGIRKIEPKTKEPKKFAKSTASADSITSSVAKQEDSTRLSSRAKTEESGAAPQQTRMCGSALFRRRKAQTKDAATKRQSRLLANKDKKKKVNDHGHGQSLQAQVEELAQRLRSSVEGSEDLRKRLAMISRYYETTVHRLHENIVSLKNEQAVMQVDLTKQIKSMNRERLVAIKRTQLLVKEQQMAKIQKH